MQEEKVLDAEQWKVEAQAVINDVRNHVQLMTVSEKLTSNNKYIYLNMTTLEGLEFCVELSGAGFKIVGNRHDENSNKTDETFETPYSLLNVVSPKFKDSFGGELLNKLQILKESQP